MSIDVTEPAPADTPSIPAVHAELTAPGAPFELEEVDALGARVRAWKNAPRSMRAQLEASRAHGDAAFIVYEDETLTFAQHFAAAARLATTLVERYGVTKGDRVAIAMRNYPEWPIAFWGAAAAGAIVVPLNAWWTGPELVYGLRDSGSRVLFADAERHDRLADDLAGLDVATVVVRRPSGRPLAAGAERWEDVFPGPAPDDARLPEVEIGPEDLATIFYTSGTTGEPKGALGTHRNFCGNLMSVGFSAARAALRAGRSLTPPEGQNVNLLSVPFFHVTGCHSVLSTNLANGGKIVLMYKWNAERALELIERERVRTFGGVPAMVWQVLQSPSFATRDTSSVLSIAYGGAPAAPELVRRIGELFPGRSPSNGYGLTETSSLTTMNAGVDYQRKPDSAGVPLPIVDLRIVGPDGVDVAPGAVGELWVRGPNIVAGYWGKPEATEEAFAGRWLRSGDIARIDDEGFVYIVDRAKDVVIRGGENVYCAEVEAVLFEHPDIADAAVLGVPHEVLGEEVAAVVTPRLGASPLTAEAVRAHVAGRLAGFKVPTHVVVRETPLPRNPAGKVLKRDLRAEILAAP